MSHRAGFVALIGLPNVGKSSLMNCLVGEEVAIVSALPQTTRQRITGILTVPQAQLIFLDTPGLHQSPRAINQAMMQWARQAARDADCVCAVIAANEPACEGVLREMPRGVLRAVALNKIDLVDAATRARRKAQLQTHGGPGVVIVPCSAKTGEGVDALRDVLMAHVPEGPALFPAEHYTPHPVRFLAAERIRRAAIEILHQELPYALAVEIEAFEDGERLTRIRASIIVERDSQKGMVIGRSGTMIRNIGTRAREAIERLVGTKVFLELFVKVRENWTRDPQQLRNLGLLPEK